MRSVLFIFALCIPFIGIAQQQKIRAIIQSDAQWYLRDEVLDPSGKKI